MGRWEENVMSGKNNSLVTSARALYIKGKNYSFKHLMSDDFLKIPPCLFLRKTFWGFISWKNNMSEVFSIITVSCKHVFLFDLCQWYLEIWSYQLDFQNVHVLVKRNFLHVVELEKESKIFPISSDAFTLHSNLPQSLFATISCFSWNRPLLAMYNYNYAHVESIFYWSLNYFLCFLACSRKESKKSAHLAVSKSLPYSS